MAISAIKIKDNNIEAANTLGSGSKLNTLASLQKQINDKRLKAKEMAKEPIKSPFSKIDLKQLTNYPQNVKELVTGYQPVGAYFNDKQDRMVLTLTGEKLKNKLFDTGFFSSITNFFKKLFKMPTNDRGMESYKKLFWNDQNQHSGESPKSLIKNLSDSSEKSGGHYYGQASFKLEKGKFVVDTITITDSAHYAEEELKKAGDIVASPSQQGKHNKDYYLKYIIPVNAVPGITKISDKTSEIIDTLMSNDPDHFETFYVVGGPNGNELLKNHSFANLRWKFPLAEGKEWKHIDGNLYIIKPRNKKMHFEDLTAEVIAEMQTNYDDRHPDKEFFKKCVNHNKASLAQAHLR